MKTLVLSVVIAMTSVLNTVSGNNLPEFAYNTTTNGEQVESQTVYTVENGKYLHPHLKYNYTYNADGSVSKKEVLKWSEIMQVFEKQYCLNFTHDLQENSIEYAVWDAKTDSYSDIKSKAVYQTRDSGQILNYQSYEWNKKENNWNLATEHTILNGNDGLFANK